jgi:hypothetical protein
VRDGKGLTATQELTLLVVGADAPNQAPEIVSPRPGRVSAGQPFEHTVQAGDVDGDTLITSLEIAPAGMTVDKASGKVTWSPQLKDLAAGATVVVKVTDG